jgi:CTD kinase subunit beta
MQDVTLAALYVSSKMHDTLKKPREILMASYTVRFPEQAAKSKSIVGEIDMDPAVRQQIPFKHELLWTVTIGSRAR